MAKGDMTKTRYLSKVMVTSMQIEDSYINRPNANNMKISNYEVCKIVDCILNQSKKHNVFHLNGIIEHCKKKLKEQ